MSKLFLPSGYLNMRGIIQDSMEKHHTPFTTITGARGTGKTYGALDYLYYYGIKFLYLRRTDAQREISASEDMNPFKILNKDKGYAISTKSLGKYMDGYYETTEDVDSKGRSITVYGKCVGYVAALTTFSNIRGISAQDVDVIVFDEFIPELHERRFKGEAEALLNLYESINRNRELNGQPPVYLFCLSNSNDIRSPLFEYLGIMEKVVRLTEKPKNIHELVLEDRGIRIIHIKESPISKQKEETALYKMTKGTQFFNMAISNNYKMRGKSFVKPVPLIEYIPRAQIEDIVICVHKSNHTMYVTSHLYGEPKVITMDKKFLAKEYGFVWNAAVRGFCFFDSYETFTKFTEYLNVPKDCLEMLN